MSDLTLEALQSKFSDLGKKWEGLRDLEIVQRLSRDLNTQSKKCDALKERAYGFTQDLEQLQTKLQSEWQSIEGNIRQLVEEQQPTLEKIEQDTRRFVDKLNPEQPQHFEIVNKAIEKFETAVSPIVERIEELHKDFETEFNKFTAQIRLVETTLSARDEASFTFDAGENVYLACNAEWVKDKDNTPNGVLFLTDKRLLFEQKETVGKKLGLFGGKKVHERLWAVDLAQIQNISTDRQGFFGGKDMVSLALSPDAGLPELTLEVKGAANNIQWKQHIEKMMHRA